VNLNRVESISRGHNVYVVVERKHIYMYTYPVVLGGTATLPEGSQHYLPSAVSALPYGPFNLMKEYPFIPILSFHRDEALILRLLNLAASLLSSLPAAVSGNRTERVCTTN